MKLNPNNKFFTLLEVQDNGMVKVRKAQRHYTVNQHKTKWQLISSRDFARALNQSELVIK